MEVALENHYKTIAFTPEFAQVVRASIHEALADQEAAQLLLRKHLEEKLATLAAQEENLLDLAADGDLPQAKIRSRLHEIGRTRTKINADLGAVETNLGSGAKHIEAYLDLLTNPYETYMKASDFLRSSSTCS